MPATLCQMFLSNFSWSFAQVTDVFFSLYAGTRFFEVECAHEVDMGESWKISVICTNMALLLFKEGKREWAK